MAIPADDPEHRNATHHRWVARCTRNTTSSDHQEAWYAQQCGGCWSTSPRRGLRIRLGVCTNAKSSFDGRVTFEHDGCEHHQSAGDWVTDHERDLLSGG